MYLSFKVNYMYKRSFCLVVPAICTDCILCVFLPHVIMANKWLIDWLIDWLINCDIWHLMIALSLSLGSGLTQSAKAWHRRRRLRSHRRNRTSHLTPVKPVWQEYGLQRPVEPVSRLSHVPCKQLHSAAHQINQSINAFYPRDAMLARVIEIATCLSVRHAPVLCQNEES